MPQALIAEAIDLVVFIAGRGANRRVETIARVTGHDGHTYRLQPVTDDDRDHLNPDEDTPS